MTYGSGYQDVDFIKRAIKHPGLHAKRVFSKRGDTEYTHRLVGYPLSNLPPGEPLNTTRERSTAKVKNCFNPDGLSWGSMNTWNNELMSKRLAEGKIRRNEEDGRAPMEIGWGFHIMGPSPWDGVGGSAPPAPRMPPGKTSRPAAAAAPVLLTTRPKAHPPQPRAPPDRLAPGVQHVASEVLIVTSGVTLYERWFLGRRLEPTAEVRTVTCEAGQRGRGHGQGPRISGETLGTLIITVKSFIEKGPTCITASVHLIIMPPEDRHQANAVRDGEDGRCHDGRRLPRIP
ncbi:MAG: hypothetical protein GY772_24685 [bacterium]|nr:hypothetical protein [bacterium]